PSGRNGGNVPSPPTSPTPSTRQRPAGRSRSSCLNRPGTEQAARERGPASTTRPRNELQGNVVIILGGAMAADSPLDAYSAIVAGVAGELTPKVASLRVSRGQSRMGEGLGSAVVYTTDGFLLTNAHVVGSASGGTAQFSDGTSSPFTVVGSDP